MRAIAVAVGVFVIVGASAACDEPECVVNNDCNVGFDCSLDGVCVSTPQGEIRWISPEPGSVVGERFDAVVEVSFRAPEALITIDRDVVESGEACAPFVPTQARIVGDLQEALVQQVTLPGLFSLGESFGVSATLNAAGGTRSVRVNFRGEPTGYDGADIDIEGAPRVGANLVDAEFSLALPIAAEFDRAVSRALVSMEPLGGEPTPRQIVGGGVLEIVGVLAPVARGPQILWVDTEDEGGTHRCGLGVNGSGAPSAGVELGLSFEGAEPGQLDLRVQVERADLSDGAVACSFNEPGTSCEPLYETRAPTRAGEEVLLVKDSVAGTGSVVTVAVVPGSASPSMLARVRVSSNGAHIGWLGPFPLQPAQGEAWIAGRIVLDGSLARLERIDQITFGAPF